MLEAPLLAHLFRAGLVQQLAHAFGPVEGIVWTCRWVWFTESLLSAFLQIRFGEDKMALDAYPAVQVDPDYGSSLVAPVSPKATRSIVVGWSMPWLRTRPEIGTAGWDHDIEAACHGP